MQPLITVAVPSLNQGRFLDQALASIFAHDLPLEVFLADGGSTDTTLDVISKWEGRLAGWRSHKDRGQSSAINEVISKGSAPFVCWLNSDDYFLSGGLNCLLSTLQTHPTVPVAYGMAGNITAHGRRRKPVRVERFNVDRLAVRCIISQPATLIRRDAWDAVGGLNEDLEMALDYDLWWRLYRKYGEFAFIEDYIAMNRTHRDTKTSNKRRLHYREAMDVVRRHYGSVPAKWYLAQPYSVWFKSFQAGMVDLSASSVDAIRRR